MKEFFRNDHGGQSMTRLLMFLSCLVTSTLMLILAFKGHMTEGYFATYVAAYGLAYVGGKFADRSKSE